MALAAQGYSRPEIEDATGLPDYQVRRELIKPKSQEDLITLRGKVRAVFMQESSRDLAQGTMGLMRQAIQAGDAKSLELSARAATHIDKLTVSASGEAQARAEASRPQVAHVTVLDLKSLISQMLGKESAPAISERAGT